MTDHHSQNGQDKPESLQFEPKNCNRSLDDLFWWVMLLVAVLAIPSLAISVVLALPLDDFTSMLVFTLTCWVSVILGMWLMKKCR